MPLIINYQWKLTKSTGAPLDTTIERVFTIYVDSSDTTPLWTETQPLVAVEKGVFNVLLGSVDSIPPLFFHGSTRYLGVSEVVNRAVEEFFKGKMVKDIPKA